MSKPRSYFKCWLLVSWLPLVCAVLGIVIESIRVAARPLPYISVAKLTAERTNPSAAGWTISDPYAGFCGTLIETLESSEMRRRAAERVRSLQPDLKVCDVRIDVRQEKDKMLFDVEAVGSEPLYTHVFLDALLNAYMAFISEIKEQWRSKPLNTLVEDVFRREKVLEERQEKLTSFEKANNIALLSGELNRLTELVLRLRSERDEANRKLRDTPATAEPDAHLASIDRELGSVGKQIEQLNSTVAIHDGLAKDYQEAKRGHDEILDLARRLNFDKDPDPYRVNILERASGSVLDFRKWLRALILGASAGLILSLYFAEVLHIASPRTTESPGQRDKEPASV